MAKIHEVAVMILERYSDSEIKDMMLGEARDARQKGPQNWHDDEPLHTVGDTARKMFGMRGPTRGAAEEAGETRSDYKRIRSKAAARPKTPAPAAHTSYDPGRSKKKVQKAGFFGKMMGRKDKVTFD